MDFEFNETQIMFQNMAKDFTEREVKPVAMEYDRRVNAREAIPLDLIKKGFEQDFHKMAVPTNLGGLGLDCLTSVMMIEEFAVGDPGFAMAWHVNNIAMGYIANLGSDEQAEEFIRPLMEEPGLGAASVTEPNTGMMTSILVDPENAAYDTFARAEGNEWVINGDKSFGSNGGLPFTKWVLVNCRTDMTKMGPVSGGWLIVPTDTKGFQLTGEEDKMGHRLANSQSFKLTNARVPKKNFVFGGKQRKITFDSYASVGAIAIGIARAAYEAAVEYAKQRKVLGKPIITYQAIQSKIADMYIGLETARTFIWRTANYSDTHPVMDLRLSRAVKIFASETANKVVNDALQIFGGYGYSKGSVTEKAYRDVRVTTIYQGTNDAIRINLSKLIEKSS